MSREDEKLMFLSYFYTNKFYLFFMILIVLVWIYSNYYILLRQVRSLRQIFIPAFSYMLIVSVFLVYLGTCLLIMLTDEYLGFTYDKLLTYIAILLLPSILTLILPFQTRGRARILNRENIIRGILVMVIVECLLILLASRGIIVGVIVSLAFCLLAVFSAYCSLAFIFKVITGGAHIYEE